MDTEEARVAQLARHVGLSFQNPDDQLFHDSVESEIRYGPKNLDFDEERTDDTVERAISRLDLENVRERNPYDLGLPRRKRVAVASVLAMDSQTVVLDEPTGGQDAPGTELLGTAVEELVADGKLVVVITHDVGFARRHADRVIALGQGEVLLDGAPREVFGKPDVLAETDVDPPVVHRVEHVHASSTFRWRLDQLHQILVAGVDHDAHVLRTRQSGIGRDHIVGLEVIVLDPGNAKRLDERTHEWELNRQVRDHCRAIGFVVGIDVVTERAPLRVKDDAQVRGDL